MANSLFIKATHRFTKKGKHHISFCPPYVAGISDLILLFPSGGKSALCIEMKKPKQKGRSAGTQSTEQKKWQALVTTYGGVYGICHGLCEFIRLVCSYLKANPAPYIEQALKQFPNYL